MAELLKEFSGGSLYCRLYGSYNNSSLDITYAATNDGYNVNGSNLHTTAIIRNTSCTASSVAIYNGRDTAATYSLYANGIYIAGGSVDAHGNTTITLNRDISSSFSISCIASNSTTWVSVGEFKPSLGLYYTTVTLNNGAYYKKPGCVLNRWVNSGLGVYWKPSASVQTYGIYTLYTEWSANSLSWSFTNPSPITYGQGATIKLPLPKSFTNSDDKGGSGNYEYSVSKAVSGISLKTKSTSTSYSVNTTAKNLNITRTSKLVDGSDSSEVEYVLVDVSKTLPVGSYSFGILAKDTTTGNTVEITVPITVTQASSWPAADTDTSSNWPDSFNYNRFIKPEANTISYNIESQILAHNPESFSLPSNVSATYYIDGTAYTNLNDIKKINAGTYTITTRLSSPNISITKDLTTTVAIGKGNISDTNVFNTTVTVPTGTYYVIDSANMLLDPAPTVSLKVANKNTGNYITVNTSEYGVSYSIIPPVQGRFNAVAAVKINNSSKNFLAYVDEQTGYALSDTFLISTLKLIINYHLSDSLIHTENKDFLGATSVNYRLASDISSWGAPGTLDFWYNSDKTIKCAPGSMQTTSNAGYKDGKVTVDYYAEYLKSLLYTSSGTKGIVKVWVAVVENGKPTWKPITKIYAATGNSIWKEVNL